MEVVRAGDLRPGLAGDHLPGDVDDAIRAGQLHRLRPVVGVCTNRLDDIMRFVRELNVASVNVWEVPGYRLEVTPFGGIKDSGLGTRKGVQSVLQGIHQRQDLLRPAVAPSLKWSDRSRDPLLNLLAAIALLVWGTHIVRTGMLRVFGENLRCVRVAASATAASPALAGLGVTSLVQSSTATCLIVASFVGTG